MALAGYIGLGELGYFFKGCRSWRRTDMSMRSAAQVWEEQCTGRVQ
jgi:hypothetical protein